MKTEKTEKKTKIKKVAEVDQGEVIDRKLTPREERFCQEYIIDLSVKNAFLRSGENNCSTYSSLTAVSSRMKKKCQWRIDQLLAERAIRTEVDQDYVVAKLLENVAKSSEAQPVLDFKGRQVTTTDDTGNKCLAVYKYDSIGRNRALELLGKHLGMFTDKVEVKGNLDIASAIQLARKRASEQGKDTKEKE